MKPFVLAGREQIIMHRSRQGFFLLYAQWESEREGECGFFCIPVIYMSENQNGFI